MDNQDNEDGSDGAGGVWEIVDLFRANAAEGWVLRMVAFSTTRTVHMNGTDWRVMCSIDGGARGLEGTVHFHADDLGPLEQMIEIVASVQSVERRLTQEGYEGRMSIDDVGSGSLTGFFTKPLPDVESVRREIAFLDHFDLRGSA